MAPGRIDIFQLGNRQGRTAETVPDQFPDVNEQSPLHGGNQYQRIIQGYDPPASCDKVHVVVVEEKAAF